MTDKECVETTERFLDTCENEEWTIAQTTSAICWLAAQVSRALRKDHHHEALVEFHSALIAGMESRDPAHLSQLLSALAQQPKEVN